LVAGRRNKMVDLQALNCSASRSEYCPASSRNNRSASSTMLGVQASIIPKNMACIVVIGVPTRSTQVPSPVATVINHRVFNVAPNEQLLSSPNLLCTATVGSITQRRCSAEANSGSLHCQRTAVTQRRSAGADGIPQGPRVCAPAVGLLSSLLQGFGELSGSCAC
jgi:hypothetical protein